METHNNMFLKKLHQEVLFIMKKNINNFLNSPKLFWGIDIILTIIGIGLLSLAMAGRTFVLFYAVYITFISLFINYPLCNVIEKNFGILDIISFVFFFIINVLGLYTQNMICSIFSIIPLIIYVMAKYIFEKISKFEELSKEE